MGSYFSTAASESHSDPVAPNTSNDTVDNGVSESEFCLSDELCKLNSNRSDDDTMFEVIRHQSVDVDKMSTSLERMRSNRTFRKFDTYQMVQAKMPTFVISKRKINETEISCHFGAPTYHDVYGQYVLDDEIKVILVSYVSSDISDIILQYCGDRELLFSAKIAETGAMTLSTTTIVIGDALTIECTCSEKRGRFDSITMNDKYNKKLHMYMAWICKELSQWDQSQIMRLWLFNFDAFMRFEISDRQRPPPPSICVLGQCLVLMDSGFKRARDIRSGDFVKTSNGTSVRVICTVTQRIDEMMKICKIGNCYITPEHPIRTVRTRDWKIPYKEVGCTDMYVGVLNNFILESGHQIIVDNVECITLGHMFSDPVVKHKIWGTQVVCDFLKSFPSYPDVVMDGTMAVQDLLRL